MSEAEMLEESSDIESLRGRVYQAREPLAATTRSRFGVLRNKSAG